MELTEKDMLYIIKGRVNKQYAIRIFASMAAVLVPGFLLTAFGDVPGLIVGLLWLCGGFVAMMVYTARTEKAQKAEAKKMFGEWQSESTVSGSMSA